MSRIRIPADLSEPSSITNIGPIRITPQRVATVGIGVMIWFAVSKAIVGPLFGLGTIVSLIAMAPWTLLPAIAFAFVKVKHRPLDQYLGDWLVYRFSPGLYIDAETSISDLYRDEDMEMRLALEEPDVRVTHYDFEHRVGEPESITR